MLIHGIIFDLDGTILNSFDERVKAWKRAFEDHGFSVRSDELEPLIGLPGVDLASRFCQIPRIIERTEEAYFSQSLKKISLFHDVLPTIEILSNLNIKSIVVTSSRKTLVEKISLPYIPVVTIDDVKKGKPDVEPYLKAASVLDIPIENFIAVGDSQNDMTPAFKLGIPAVLARHGKEREVKSDYQIDNIGELIPLLNTLMDLPVK